jgi:hypothetical protein
LEMIQLKKAVNLFVNDLKKYARWLFLCLM